MRKQQKYRDIAPVRQKNIIEREIVQVLTAVVLT